MKYIQRKDNYGNFETVDQFEFRKEAINMLKEYRLSDQSAYYYVSQKPCRDWQEIYQEKS
tara:strand:+ start:256 stop:435 length:180 start_codon:yes stop_codon:yes gene_type:complete